MRNVLVPAALAILLGTSGFAMAATYSAPAAPAAKPAAAAAAAPQSVSSTIKALNLAKHSLTLANGKTYVLPATFKDPGLKVGEKVTVKWQMKGTEYDAQSVTIG
jgi:hypothetical protein